MRHTLQMSLVLLFVINALIVKPAVPVRTPPTHAAGMSSTSNTPSASTEAAGMPSSTPSAIPDSPPIPPLPRGCIGTGTPINPNDVCCISGYVYRNGQPIDHAIVVLQANNYTISTTTQYTNGSTLPHFMINLYESSLGVQPNQVVTMTSVVDGYTKSVTFTAVPGGQQVDIVLPQNGPASSWIRGETLIPERYRHGMAYDANQQQTIVFGGINATTTLSDTWSWDGTIWYQLRPTLSPSARRWHTMSYDEHRQRIVLFGGEQSAPEGVSLLNDTWEWDGTNWAHRTSATSPQPRRGQAMVYDSIRQRTILFGGEGTVGGVPVLLNDMWEWDGATWTQVASASTPFARRDHVMAFDPQRQRLVLFGGTNNSIRYSDLWEWDGTNWARKYPTSSPPPRIEHAMAYDPQRQEIVLVGGLNDTALNDIWRWNGTRWLRIQSSSFTPHVSHRMVYDPVRQQLVVFGGRLVNGYSYDQVWVNNADTWIQRYPRSVPGVGSRHRVAYDSQRQTVVLYGGVKGNYISAETWEFDGVNWTKFSPAVFPPARLDHAMAYDAARQNVMLFGGWTINGTQNIFYNDTWAWDGLAWSLLAPAQSPSARRYATMAYDTQRQKIFLFGGYSPTAGNLNDLWEWDGTTWIQHTPLVSPPAVTESKLVYDEARQRLVLFTGIVDYTVGNQIWEWDGQTWQQMNPIKRPSARIGAALTYDPDRRRVVLFGGNGSSIDHNLSDTWEWDGLQWVERFPVRTPSPRYLHEMAYDVQHHRIVLFGGYKNAYTYTDTWFWNGEDWISAPNNGLTPASIGDKALAYENDGSTVLFGDQSGGMFNTITYRWQGNQWTQLTNNHTPSGRAGHRMARNSTGSTILLFGGQASTGAYLGDTWLWNGSDWLSKTLALQPAPRAHYGLTYDPVRQVWLLFGGQDADTYFNDLWQFDGTAWTQIATALKPPARANATLTFDEQRGRAVLVGGQHLDGFLDDVWEWDGTTWQNVTPTQRLAARTKHAAGYDRVNKAVIVAGGLVDDVTALNDTWQWDGSSWTERISSPNLPPISNVAIDYDDAHAEFVAVGGNFTYLHRSTGAADNPHPIATINQLSPHDARQGIDTIYFIGRGADADDTDQIQAFRWTHNGSTISTQASFNRTASAFPVGVQVIRLEVQDNEGRWSPAVEQTILIRDANGGIDPNPSWTLLIYAVGDNDLAAWLKAKMNTLQASTAPSNVQIGILYDGPNINDTYRAIFTGGQWYSQALTEARMDDASTLRNFIIWGRTALQSDYYALSLVDHANGVVGIGQDMSSDSSGNAFLTPGEIRSALKQATNDGEHKIDIVQFDGCSFGLLENAAIAKGQATIVIASPNTSWAVFPYDRYRSIASTAANPRVYAQQVVQAYASAVNYYLLPYTIAAYDLDYLDAALLSIGALGDQLVAYINNGNDPILRIQQLQSIRAATQIYDSGGSAFLHLDSHDSYIDVRDWTLHIQAASTTPEVRLAATHVLTALDTFIIAERHTSGTIQDVTGSFHVNLDASHGLGIYYPTSRAESPAFEPYTQHHIFDSTIGWGWVDFLLTALPSPQLRTAQASEGLLTAPNPEEYTTVVAHLFLPLIAK